MPCSQQSLKIKTRADDVKYVENKQVLQDNQAKYYNLHTKQLGDLNIGEEVRMLKNGQWRHAVVQNKCEEPRSFIIKTEDGKTFRRNWQHIRQTPLNSTKVQPTVISDDENEISDNDETLNKNEKAKAKEADVIPEMQQAKQVKTRSGRVTRKPSRLDDYVWNGNEQ